NLAPITVSFVRSDGHLLRTLLAERRSADRLCAVGALLGAIQAGRRPREFDPGWIARATALPDGSAFDAAGAQLAYCWALDHGDAGAAESFLRRAVAASVHLPLPERAMFAAEEAFFAAHYRRDGAAARAALDRARTGITEADRHA